MRTALSHNVLRDYIINVTGDKRLRLRKNVSSPLSRYVGEVISDVLSEAVRTMQADGKRRVMERHMRCAVVICLGIDFDKRGRHMLSETEWESQNIRPNREVLPSHALVLYGHMARELRQFKLTRISQWYAGTVVYLTCVVSVALEDLLPIQGGAVRSDDILSRVQHAEANLRSVYNINNR